MHDLESVVEEYLSSLEGGHRRLAPTEWGLTVESPPGWPLHVGVALRDGLLRVQTEALPPDRVGDHELLHRNRGLRFARYTHAGDGTVWVEADVPPQAVTPQLLDRLLGSVVAAATAVRERARALQ